MSVEEPGQSATPPARRILGILVLTALLLTVVILLISAHIRITATGVGCAPWPACFAAPTTAESGGLELPRLVHRGAAMLLGIVVLAIFGLAARNRPDTGVGMVRPTAIVVCTLLLALLGRLTPNTALPAVTLGNVTGGMLLALLLYSLRLDLALSDRGEEPAGERWVRWLLPLATGWLALSGAWASANLSIAGCAGGLLCDGGGALAPGSLLDLTRRLDIGVTQDGGVDPVATGMLVMHRLSGLLLVPALVLAIAARWRDAPRLAPTLLALLVLNALLAWWAHAGAPPIWAGDLHRALSLAALLASCHLAWR